MIIEEGYWNYYLAFRIDNYQKHVLEMTKEKLLSRVVAYVSGDTVLVNKNNKDILDKRKENFNEAKLKLSGKEKLSDLQDLYEKNDLPESFFDFNVSANDLLENKINDSIDEVNFASYGYQSVFGTFGKEKCGYYVLMPLKMYYSEWDYQYCAVYIQLLTNGNGVIKLEVPINNTPTDVLSSYPMKRWYSYIKVWDALYSPNGEEKYKILSGEINGVEDITDALMRYVQNFFVESIVDKDRFLGFESFVISKTAKSEILNVNESNHRLLEEMYYFALPENFALTPNKEQLKKFWSESHYDASGIQVVFGDRARIVMYADVSLMLSRNRREDIVSEVEYLQSSVSASFDPFILLALAQKDNEISIYRIAEQDRHIINRKMTQYYSNLNYFEGIMLSAPKHGVDFYKRVREMLDECMIDFREMLHRMQIIEDYEKLRLNEKHNSLINKFSLIFTVLFGLPLIQESLLVLKDILKLRGDIIPFITIGHISLVTWLVLLFILFTDYIDSYIEYEGYRVKSSSSWGKRFKEIFFVIGLRLIKKRKI